MLGEPREGVGYAGIPSVDNPHAVASANAVFRRKEKRSDFNELKAKLETNFYLFFLQIELEYDLLSIL